MACDEAVPAMTLVGPDDSRRAVLDLLGGMRRTLCLYTPQVRAELYDDAGVLAAMRAAVVGQPRLRLRLLLPPAREWRTACPGLLRLSERLSSALLLRTPDPEVLTEQPELGQAFLIADARALLRLSDPQRLLGSYEPQPSDRLKERLELFERLWSRAQPDPALSRLGL